MIIIIQIFVLLVSFYYFVLATTNMSFSDLIKCHPNTVCFVFISVSHFSLFFSPSVVLFMQHECATVSRSVSVKPERKLCFPD